MGNEGVDYNNAVSLLQSQSYRTSNLDPSPSVHAGNSTYDTLGLTRPQFYTKPWSKLPIQKRGPHTGIVLYSTIVVNRN